MTAGIQSPAPRLNALQIAWLQEIGIDKRMLARYAVDAGPFPISSEGPPQDPSVSAGSSAAGSGGAAPKGPPQARQGEAAPAPLARPGASGKNPLADQPAPGSALSHDWEALQTHVAACEACNLVSGRSQAVFGAGAAQSPEWMIVGEAPGEQDDRLGLPFQGRPGVLLQAMLASIGAAPESAVFFTNLVKCRPLGNRPPEPAEIAACMPYLQRQIALLKPRRILALGKLAAQALLGVDDELELLRGRIHHITSETGRDIPLVATYHPASLLMRPQHKADAWQDLNLARSIASV